MMKPSARNQIKGRVTSVVKGQTTGHVHIDIDNGVTAHASIINEAIGELALADGDEATAESFMKTLRHEEVDASAYRDLAHARAAIGEFSEAAYDRQRLHSALACLSPVSLSPTSPGPLRSGPGL